MKGSIHCAMGEVERVQKLIFFIFFLLLRGRGVEVFFFFFPDV